MVAVIQICEKIVVYQTPRFVLGPSFYMERSKKKKKKKESLSFLNIKISKVLYVGGAIGIVFDP